MPSNESFSLVRKAILPFTITFFATQAIGTIVAFASIFVLSLLMVIGRVRTGILFNKSNIKEMAK
jgi:hypothetical protein